MWLALVVCCSLRDDVCLLVVVCCSYIVTIDASFVVLGRCLLSVGSCLMLAD